MNITVWQIFKAAMDFLIVPAFIVIWNVHGRVSTIEGKLEVFMRELRKDYDTRYR